MAEQKRLLTLRDVFYIFFKNKTVISIVFLVAVCGALIYCAVTPAKYRAEAKILIRMGKAQTSGIEQLRPEQQTNMLFTERTQNIRNEIEILKGEYLSEKVVAKLKDRIREMNKQRSIFDGLREELQNFLRKSGLTKQEGSPDKGLVLLFMQSFGVTYLEDSDMIRLTFDWTNPRFAALVANTYAEEYVNQHTLVYDSQRSYRFYIDQIELAEKKLRDAENELQDFISKSNLANIELQKELLLRNISELANRYSSVSVDHAQALTKLRKIKEMAKTPGVWIETPSDIGNASADKQAYLRTLDDSYFKLKVERERLLKNYTPLSAEIKAIDVQLNNLRHQKGESLTNIVNLDAAMAENKKNSLQNEISNERKKLEDINAKTLTLRQMQRTRDLAESNYQVYKRKAEDLRISDDLDARKISSVKIAMPAIPPLQSAYPKKGLIVVVAAFIGLIAGFGFSAIREFFNHTFKDDNTVSTHLEVPLLMSVPLSFEEEHRSFFAGLVGPRNGIQAKVAATFHKGVAPHGQFSMQGTNSLLAVLSIVTLAFSGYFAYTTHFLSNSDMAASAEKLLVGNEKYLAQGLMVAGHPPGDRAEFVCGSIAREEGVVKKETIEESKMKGAPSQGKSSVVLNGASPAAGNAKNSDIPSSKRQETAALEHTVSRGQTIVSILRNVYLIPEDFIFNESIELVKKANPGLKDYNNLCVGQKILIPPQVIEKSNTVGGRANKKG